ncbi:MAG: PIG-L family deacetylase [Desulfobacula sp.]|jgi:LmbE family N-acetylglucosaminyl deacetylase|nr:PIG-L family deacetylase [Desulfobacula sp.]
MNFIIMNILAVGAHYDDIELGCGGTLINHVKNGDNVIMLVISDSGYNDPAGRVIRASQTAKREGKTSAKIIGAELIQLNYKTFFIPFDETLTADITDIINKNHIDTIYSHWTGDIHRDHQNTAKSVMMAARHAKRLMMYQSNWYDSDKKFNPCVYSDISRVIQQKLKAVKAHQSEIDRTDSVWIEYLINKHKIDGLKIGVEYAESFEPVKYLL